MATPNNMPGRNKVREQLVAALIKKEQSSWTLRSFRRNNRGEEEMVQNKITYDVLRYPLAKNVSELNVEALAARWLR